MNKYLAQLADHYALWQLHQKRSREDQFYNGSKEPLSLSEFNHFYQSPKVPEIKFEPQNDLKNYELSRFYYESEITDNGDSNKYASGLFYQPKCPSGVNVVIIHGWRTETLKITTDIFLDSFMKRNYNIYLSTLPYHFERNIPEVCYNGEYLISANIDRTLLSINQTISDVRALIGFIKSQKNNKIILIGVSLGGLMANLVSVVEKQHDALISVFYANSLAHSVFKTKPGKYIKYDFEAHGFTYEQLKSFWTILNPGNFKPVIPKENILLMSGLYDQYISLEDSDNLCRVWEKPRRILYPCGHSGLVLLKRQIARDSNRFIEKITSRS